MCMVLNIFFICFYKRTLIAYLFGGINSFPIIRKSANILEITCFIENYLRKFLKDFEEKFKGLYSRSEVYKWHLQRRHVENKKNCIQECHKLEKLS